MACSPPGHAPERWRQQSWLTHQMIGCLLEHPWTHVPQGGVQPHRIVNLSEGVAPSARLQNRTGEFPRIRLLNDRVFGTDTVDTTSVSFIMAMSMQQAFVAEFFSPAFTFGCDVINGHFPLIITHREKRPCYVPGITGHKIAFIPGDRLS